MARISWAVSGRAERMFGKRPARTEAIEFSFCPTLRGYEELSNIATGSQAASCGARSSAPSHSVIAGDRAA
jgi:hypothetical protein